MFFDPGSTPEVEMNYHVRNHVIGDIVQVVASQEWLPPKPKTKEPYYEKVSLRVGGVSILIQKEPGSEYYNLDPKEKQKYPTKERYVRNHWSESLWRIELNDPADKRLILGRAAIASILSLTDNQGGRLFNPSTSRPHYLFEFQEPHSKK